MGMTAPGHKRPGGSYTELFEEVCPIYMNFGMTYDQFWNGDCEMAPAYRRANRYKQEEMHYAAWLHGAYVYEALTDVAPILRAFSKARKPHEYPKQPYGLEERDGKRMSKEEKQYRKDKVRFETWVVGFNQQFQKKAEVTDDGGQRRDPGD